jgi:hypothetical protein
MSDYEDIWEKTPDRQAMEFNAKSIYTYTGIRRYDHTSLDGTSCEIPYLVSTVHPKILGHQKKCSWGNLKKNISL